MKIICIGRNYVDHAKELNNPVPEEPIFFLKPDSAILRANKPFFYPDFSKEIHYEVEIVIRINRLGKNIQKRFASKYYSEIGIGLDLTARDIQREHRSKGLPWEKAKAFDGSAPISKFIPLSELEDLSDISFHLNINGATVQRGNTRDMIFTFDQLIAHISRFMTLKIGDLIFTGTPVGVGPIAIGDVLECYIGNRKLLECKVK